jgi:hypothetical protein
MSGDRSFAAVHPDEFHASISTVAQLKPSVTLANILMLTPSQNLLRRLASSTLPLLKGPQPSARFIA